MLFIKHEFISKIAFLIKDPQTKLATKISETVINKLKDMKHAKKKSSKKSIGSNDLIFTYLDGNQALRIGTWKAANEYIVNGAILKKEVSGEILVPKRVQNIPIKEHKSYAFKKMHENSICDN